MPYKNYFEILNVSRDATSEEIRKNYIRLAKRLHPDNLNGNSEKFKLVSIAYWTLRDERRRREYDLQLRYFKIRSRNYDNYTKNSINYNSKFERFISSRIYTKKQKSFSLIGIIIFLYSIGAISELDKFGTNDIFAISLYIIYFFALMTALQF